MMTVTMHCHALSPSAIREDPVVHPPMLKEPVMTQRVTNSQGPYVRRLGGSGRLSSFPSAVTDRSSPLTSTLSRRRLVVPMAARQIRLASSDAVEVF